MIRLDGRYGEGGGQIVRTALALSTLTNKPFRVRHIRKGRKKPGLKAQHLTAVEALQELCDAKAPGAMLGSWQLEYYPGDIHYKSISIDIGTAGSITLLLQALLPVALFSHKPIRISVIGGTDTAWSVPVDSLTEVFLPHLSAYAAFEPKIEKRGYYPKGGGLFEVMVRPKYTFQDRQEAPSFDLVKRHKLVSIKGVSHASKDLMQADVAERTAKAAKYMLMNFMKPRIAVEYADTLSTGSGITLWSLYTQDDEVDRPPIILGADALGKKGRPAAKVGQEAAKKLIAAMESGACVDEHTADQLIPFLGLFGGSMRVQQVSEHLKTNIYVTEQFLDVKFAVKDDVVRADI